MPENTQIKLFEEKKVRSIWDENEQQWYFSVIDVVEVLTESVNPRDYWFKMKKRVHSEDGLELSTICRQFKMTAQDGKMRETDCANVKSLLRIIQSIPSPKAEPFKQWLAQVGYERMQEIENPELAQKRMKEIYEKKGYPKDWIDKRLRGIAIRQNLTDEWKERGITEISQQEKPEDFEGNKDVARRGGNVAGVARKETEKELGHSVISSENFLNLDEKSNGTLPENNLPE